MPADCVKNERNRDKKLRFLLFLSMFSNTLFKKKYFYPLEYFEIFVDNVNRVH